MDHAVLAQRTRLWRLTLAAFGALLLAAVLAAPASADPEAHPYLPALSHIEEAPEGACGAAVDSHGDVYVGEGYEIGIFDPAGQPLTSFVPETVDGEPIEPCRLAVDSDGDIYAATRAYYQPESGALYKFKPIGGDIPAAAYEIDTSAGDDGMIVPRGANAVAIDPLDQDVVVGEAGINEEQALTWPTGTNCPSGSEVTVTYTPTGTTTAPVSCSVGASGLETALRTALGREAAWVFGNRPNFRVELDSGLGNENVPTGMLQVHAVPSGALLATSTAMREGARSSISVYSPSGASLGSEIGNGVAHASYDAVSVDGPTGRIYALDSQAREIYGFDAHTATPAMAFHGPNAGFGWVELNDIAVDQATGHVYVADLGNSFGFPAESNGVIDEFTGSGQFVSQIGPQVGDEGLEIENGNVPDGIAVDNGTASPNRGTVYVASGYSLYAFGPEASVPTPQVLGISPDKGQLAGGTAVTLTGRNLAGADTTGGAVEFGDVPATNVTVNGTGTQLTATAPAHVGGTVDVTVTTEAGGTSAESPSDEYTYFGTPSVTHVTPNKGPLGGGQTVTIEGDNLEDVTEVKFGSTVLSSSIVEEGAGTKLKVTSPSAASAGTVQISVTTPGGTDLTTDSTGAYTYVVLPTVTAVTPNKGPLGGGQTVTIEGDNLEDVTEVKFGSTVLSSSIVEEGAGTKLKVTSPSASVEEIVDVRVRTAGGISLAGAGDEYAYIAPLTFTVNKAGTGSGTVSCDGGACGSSYPYGSSVSLEATVDPGSSFAGFTGGGCTGSAATCTVLVKSRTTVTAAFEAVPQKKEGGSGSTPPPSENQEDAVPHITAAAPVKGGKAQLSVSCPGPGACKGTIKLTAKIKVGKKIKTVVIGTATYEIPAGSSQVVKVKLSAAAKKRLKKGAIKVKISGGPKGTITLKPGG
jgi:hypothetical protein